MNKKIDVYSAPMAGITDKPFRLILRHFSDRPIFTEMINVDTLIHNHHKTLRMINLQHENNIIVQLEGSDPEKFGMAVQIVQDMGAVGVDINMGCSVKKIIQAHSGAALMQNVNLAQQIIESVKKNTSLRVSVKTRLGWNDKTELKLFTQSLQSAGVDELTVHARTKAMGFSGRADWSAVGDGIQNLKIPVIVNGDITSYARAQQAMQESHTKAVMVGRVLLGQPWKLQEIATGIKKSIPVQDIIMEHFESILSYYGHTGIFIARKHLAWYAKNKKNVAPWREKMYLEEDEKHIKKMIIDLFQ